MKTLTIQLKDGKWTVNDKPYSDLNVTELEFFNRFFNDARIASQVAFVQPDEISESVKSLIGIVDINDPAFDKPIHYVDYGN